MNTRISLMAIGLLALAGVAQAASPPASLMMIPPQINYQGRLTTPANVPYADATHSIDLTLYPTASGGAKIWSERYSVQTRDGYFSVNLGSGGAELLASNNLPIWQVLWKDTADANSPDTYFMALTVRTDQNGAALPTPVESTPRQQFLTAPFAYRAHQSVYASKADGLFTAPAGVETQSLQGNSVNIATPSLTINSKPMFVRRTVAPANSVNIGVGYAELSHGISTADYDVFMVGWKAFGTQWPVVGVSVSGDKGIMTFGGLSSGTAFITMEFLGIRKGLTQSQ
jgi:hypothetical protein